MINFTELPLEKQKEILDTLDKAKKKSKYHNIKTTRGQITFDSKKEAERYDELMAMEQAKIIRNLKLQPEFTLIEGYKTENGEKIRPERYIADFSYIDCSTGHLVIEDVKSRATATAQYKIKKKQMKDRYGYDIREV